MPRKQFFTLHETLQALANGAVVRLENRPLKYMFGLKNYGEVIGMYNRSDGDCFDIFAPGFPGRLPFDTPTRVTTIYGVLCLANGNHKICVGLPCEGFCPHRAKRELAAYCRTYPRKVRVRSRWVPAAELTPQLLNALDSQSARHRPSARRVPIR